MSSYLPLAAVLAATATGMTFLAVACGDDPGAEAPGTPDSGATTTRPGSSAEPPGNDGGSDPSDGGTPSPDSGEPNGPTTPVRFVALGDTGHGCATITDDQCKVATAMEVKCAQSGCDFAVLLGDNIYPSGASSPDDPVFQQMFEEPYKNLDFPFYPALGNHDYGHGGAGTDFARGQHQVDYTQKSTKWKLPAKYHKQSFGNGALDLFVTDTNMAMFLDENTQRAQLKSWMAASNAIWKIAIGHHPYLSNGRHGNAGCYDAPIGCLMVWPANGSGVKEFLEDAVCGNVDLYLAGHDHNRQWLTDKCKGTELIVSGAGSGHTAIEGSNPSHFEKSALGFLYVVIDGKTLTAEFIDEDGNVDFARTLTKP